MNPNSHLAFTLNDLLVSGNNPCFIMSYFCLISPIISFHFLLFFLVHLDIWHFRIFFQINSEKHRLSISGIGIKKTIALSVNDIKRKYKPITINSSIQCAGNRRAIMGSHKKVFLKFISIILEIISINW